MSAAWALKKPCDRVGGRAREILLSSRAPLLLYREWNSVKWPHRKNSLRNLHKKKVSNYSLGEVTPLFTCNLLALEWYLLKKYAIGQVFVSVVGQGWRLGKLLFNSLGPRALWVERDRQHLSLDPEGYKFFSINKLSSLAYASVKKLIDWSKDLESVVTILCRCAPTAWIDS